MAVIGCVWRTTPRNAVKGAPGFVVDDLPGLAVIGGDVVGEVEGIANIADVLRRGLLFAAGRGGLSIIATVFLKTPTNSG